MSHRSLTLFHTAEINRAPFEALVRELAPGLTVRHVVNEAILREAKAAGAVTRRLAELVDATFADVLADGAFVLCTCSTIGALAERGRPNVLRVDRPMAERAVALGRRIAVAATLTSTLGPTRALIEEVAAVANKTVDLEEWHLEQAWPLMDAGDHDGYAREIARDVAARVGGTPARPVVRPGRADVVVLAQASTAAAAGLCATPGVPVLSSPRLGVGEAIRRVRGVASDSAEVM